MHLIIDTDPGMDDLLALSIALYANAFEIDLITTVGGNVGLKHTTQNTFNLLHTFDQRIQVAEGADRPMLADPIHATHVHGDNGLAGFELETVETGCLSPEAAREAMQKVLTYNDQTTLLCLAPLTNLAQLLKQAPHLKQKIERIILMGGALGRGNIRPYTEFNMGYDPEAASIVFQSGIPITMVPLEMGNASEITLADFAPLVHSNQKGQLLYNLLAHKYQGQLDSPIILYDVTAVAYLLEPALFETKECHIDIELTGQFTRGATVVNFRSKAIQSSQHQVTTALNSEAYRDWLLTALLNIQ